jgi:two-component system response regulator MtrA
VAHILVIEDNEDLAFGLSRSLEGEGHTVCVAPDGAAGARLAAERRPALVLLDLMLPGMSGFRTLEAMRRAGLTMPVIILTARGAETDKVHGLRLGADDYVTKPFGLSELMARVAAQLRRAGAAGGEAPAEVLRFGDVEIRPAARVVAKAGARVPVTPREYDLLLAFVRQPGVVHSRVALLRDVWGHAADVMTRTVDIHVGELRRKLEDDPAAPRHFVTVWKAGYRFEP